MSESRQLQNTIRLRPVKIRLKCDRADRDRITFLQYRIIPIMPTVFKRITSVSVGSLSGHCLISVGLHSVESGRSRDRLGRNLPGERYKLNYQRIENGIVGINSLGNGWISTLPEQYLIVVVIKLFVSQILIKVWIFILDSQNLDQTFDKFWSGMVLSRTAVKIVNVGPQL